MESAGGFRQQCYELLQVTSTKDAEIELERRLMNIIHKAVKTVQDAKHSEETNTYELWLDRSSLSWDSVTKEQDSDTADRRLVHAGDRA
ncbi:hypothetical protein B7P43_G12006 [Cryptotermes secundus]|uniref:Uncharacterized protein n=2 Tax=Cryptotermes secundus TaxID=105785 RepID=A0A2J7R9Y3_9NEOP|nr:hypothetical protein B7P43_G12006 [Cryptotermes secundus]